MSDEITKISWDAICYIPNIKEIVFSSNLTELSIWTLNNDEIFVIPTYNNNIILDFSKAKQIPQIVEDNEGIGTGEDFKYLQSEKIICIKVPALLYEDWIMSPYWIDAKDKIVAV